MCQSPAAGNSAAPTTTTTMTPSPYSKPKPSNNCQNPNPNFCKQHSPLATLDVLIFILVLFSAAFLLSSYLSYIFNSLSLLILSQSHIYHPPRISYILGFLGFFIVSLILTQHCCGVYLRKCGKPGCKGMKKAMEFDLKLESEESVRSGGCGGGFDFDGLPWKGGTEDNPDYECLRSELRRMAPPNGRAVLLFRSPCGCPVAKLVGWAPKKGKRQKKSLINVTLNR